MWTLIPNKLFIIASLNDRTLNCTKQQIQKFESEVDKNRTTIAKLEAELELCEGKIKWLTTVNENLKSELKHGTEEVEENRSPVR